LSREDTLSQAHMAQIVPGASNSVAIDLITTHIRRQLEARKLKVRAQLSRGLPGPGNIDGWALPANVIVMRATNQLRVSPSGALRVVTAAQGIHTILRDSTTSKDDFIFFTKRLANLLIEESLQLMAYSDKEITTRAGHPYHGKRLATEVGVPSTAHLLLTFRAAPFRADHP
jgi:uridine kinase